MPRDNDRLLIAAGSLALYFAALWAFPLLDRDEARFTEAARDMRARGDLVVPYFNGQPRYHKPILPYWLQWASCAVLGTNELAARVPSALAGVLLALLVYELGRLLHGRAAARWAAAFIACSPLVWFEARQGTADALLAAALAGYFLALWRARLSAGAGRCAAWGAAAGAALGAAVLAKGPVALAVAGLAALASAILPAARAAGKGHAADAGPQVDAEARRAQSQRRRAATARAVLAGGAAFLLLVAPWAAAAAIRTSGDFLREGLGYHFAGRLVKSYEGHRLFPGAHTLLLAGTCFPWSPLIPPAAAALWRAHRRGDAASRFLLGWIAGPLLLFEAAASRLPHYTLPILPALALAAGAFIAGSVPAPARPDAAQRGGRAPHRGWERGRGWARAPAIALLAAAAGGAAAWLLVARLRPALADRSSFGLGPIDAGVWSCLAALAAGGLAGLLPLPGARRFSPALPAIAGWCAALALAAFLVLPRLAPLQISASIASQLALVDREPARSTVLLVTYREPSAVYYLRRGLYPSPGQVREASPREAVEILRELPDPAWIVASEEDLRWIQERGARTFFTASRIYGINLSNGRQLALCLVRAE